MGEERKHVCLQDMVILNPKSLNSSSGSFQTYLSVVQLTRFEGGCFLQTHPRFSEIERKRKIISSQSKAN